MKGVILLFVISLGISLANAQYGDDDAELIKILDQNFDAVHQRVDLEVKQLLETLSNFEDFDQEKAMVEELVQKQFDHLIMVRDLYKLLMPSMDALYEDKLVAADAKMKQMEMDFVSRMVEIQDELEQMKTKVVDLPNGQDCMTSDDCKEGFTCQPMQEHLRTYLAEIGQTDSFEEYTKQLNITGNECVLDLQVVLDHTDPFAIISRLDLLRRKVVSDMSDFQDKMNEFNVTIDLSFMDASSDVTFSPSLMLKPHQMYLMERGQEELNADQLLIMMMPGADPLSSSIAVAAKSKTNEKAGKLEKVSMVVSLLDDVKTTWNDSPATRSGERNAFSSIDPVTLMLLMGDRDLDIVTLLALTGGLGDIDPITMMLMMGKGELDTLSLLALTGGIGGDKGVDLTTLILLTMEEGETMDPMTMLALTGGMDNISPLTLRLLMGKSVDTLTLLVLSGALNNLSPLTVMLLTGDGKLDSKALLALTGGLSGDLDPTTLLLLNDENVDPIVLLAVTGGLQKLDPLAIKLLMGEEVDQISLLALSGILGDLDLVTMMLLMGKDLDPLTLSALTGGLQNVSPATLMLLLGKDLDTLTLLALTGSLGDMDGATAMLLLSDEDIDPLTLLALTGDGLDPTALLLLSQNDGDMNPLMLLALTGGLGDMNPALMIMLMGDEKPDALTLLALTGGLGDLDSTTMMLLLLNKGGNNDMLTLMALSGGLGKVDAMTMALLMGSDLDLMTLLAVTGAFGSEINPAMLLLMNQSKKGLSESDSLMEMMVLSQMMRR